MGGGREVAREVAGDLSSGITANAVEGELGLGEVGDELLELGGAEVVVANDDGGAVVLHALNELVEVGAGAADDVDGLDAAGGSDLDDGEADHAVGTVLDDDVAWKG